LSLGNLYKAIEKIESGGDPNAISSKGARGLMQVMPSTARKPGYGVKPAKNESKAEYVRVGQDYAKAMYNEFDGDIEAVLAAYNMGPGATKKWIERGRDKSKLPTETRKYIPKVQAELNKLNKGNQRRAVMAAPLAGLVPVILGSGAYTTIRAMAPAVVEKFIRAGIKGFKKVPANKLNSVPKNLKKASESQARKIIKPTPSRQGSPRVVRSKKSPTPSRQGPPPSKTGKPKIDKPKIDKPKKTKEQLNKETQTSQNREAKNQSANQQGQNKPKSNTTSSQKSPFKKTKSNNNTVVKTPSTGKKLLKNAAKIGTGVAIGSLLSPKDAGKVTAKTQKKTIAKTKPITQKKPFVAPTAKDQEELNKNVKAIPRPSSPFGPIETKARNKFIKKSGGKDAFKSDKQIDSLFVNEMLDMREGSEGNSGFGLDDQNTYEAILEERKSRKKAGGKVSKKVGGKVVKRNIGGSAKPKKKVVFRRGGGKALRGFGKATYSNKMY
jgi:hypothetical protein